MLHKAQIISIFQMHKILVTYCVCWIFTIGTLFWPVVISQQTTCTFCRKDNIGVIYMLPNVMTQIISPVQQNAEKISPFIETIASEFGIIGYIHDNYSNVIPLAAAEYNLKMSKRANASSMVQVWVYTERQKNSSFQSLKKVVDNANIIFPDTVSKIVYNPSDSAVVELVDGTMHKNLRLLREIFTAPKYRLAVLFDQGDYKNLTTMGNNISCGISTLADSIMVQSVPSLRSQFQIDHTAKEIVSVGDNFAEFFIKTCNWSTPVGLNTYFDDTSNEGITDYGAMARVWKDLAEQTSNSNMSLMLWGAFDMIGTPAEQSSVGWWVVRENISTDGQVYFNFESKAALAEKAPLHESQKFQLSRIDFDKRRVCIAFHGNSKLVQTSMQNESSSLLASLAMKVYTQFSCVLQDTHFLQANTSFSHFSAISPSSTVYPKNVILVANLTSQRHLDLLKHFSDKSKLKSGVNPVSRIILQSKINETQRLQFVTKFAGNASFKVGFMSKIRLCIILNETLSIEKAQEKFGWKDFVYFKYIPGLSEPHGYEFGVDRILAQVIALFTICKRKLNQLLPSLEVGFATGFPDTYRSRQDDYASLVIYWKELNLWAKKTNTNLIMYEAIDFWQPTRVSGNEKLRPESHLGWWKFSRQKNDFEEKRDIAMKILNFEKSESVGSFIFIVLSLAAPLVFGTGCVLAYFALGKWRRAKGDKTVRPASYIELHGDATTVLLPPSVFSPAAAKIIGAGNFGKIYKCYMSQFEAEVAVKVAITEGINDENAMKCLLSEIKTMSYVGQHENVLALLGICQEESLFLVTEYCEHGSLLSYLRGKACLGQFSSSYELLQFCFEISRGMKYLHEKGVIHGDLSTRNVLLNSFLGCKISDFGLSRKLDSYDTYMKKGEEPLPWRWMAIESLQRLEFSTKSDVWSMGVTFWEIFTLGKLPFAGKAWNELFVRELINGYRLELPNLCSDQMYSIMMSCWHMDPSNRPTSGTVLADLTILKENEYTVL